MLSSSGFRDALGARDLRFDRESGQVRECLGLRPELAAYHRALRQRVDRLASLIDPRLVPIEEVEHEPDTGRVTVVSYHVSGLRLQQILRSAREHELVPDLTIALFFTTELLTAAHALHAQAGVPHGAIAADRVIVTPTGQVVLADYAYAEAIEAARFKASRLWREFGIAQWFGEPFSVAGDIRQSALAGIALMLGRPLDAVDMPDGLDTLLIEVEEAAMIRGGRLFAEPVIAWLTRAFGSNSYDTAEEAAHACAALLTDRERAIARPALEDFLEELDQAAPAPMTITSSATATPEPEPVAVARPESEPEPRRREVEDEPQWTFTPEREPEPEPFAEEGPISEPTVFARAAGAPSRSVTEFPRDVEPEPEPVIERESEILSEPVAVNGPMFSARSDAQTPVPSTTAWPPPPTTAAFDVGPDAGPRVVSTSPLSLVQGGATAKSPAPDAPFAPPPPYAAPIGVPGLAPRSLDPVATPPIVEHGPVVTPAADAVTTETTTIRLKGDTGIRLKETLAPRTSSTSLDLTDRPAPEFIADAEEPESRFRKIPWKYVAVAFAVVATGFAATTVKWRSSAPPTENKKPEVVAPPPVAAPAATTGALQVLSNNTGAKVVIDGTVRGEVPLTIDDLEPGRHVVIVRAPNGNVRRVVTINVGKTTTLDLTVYSGWVIVSAPIEVSVLDGDKSIGNGGDAPIVLTAGPHEIVLVNEALGYRSSHSVDIQPGEEERIAVDPKGTANFNAVPWAEVWLEGNKLGETPLGNIQIPLGTREFTFKHPEYGERKVSATIAASSTAQISVDFTRQP